MKNDLRFIYMHIPKTGGVSFRSTLENAVRQDEIWHVTDVQRFDPRAVDEHANARFIHGHFSFQQISGISGFIKIVSLREPVERSISNYNFWRSLDSTNPGWSDQARKNIEEAQRHSLEHLMSLEDPLISSRFSNYQTRLLSTAFNSTEELTEEHLQRAMANLDNFDFIATTEQLDLATQLMCLKYGLFNPRATPRLNETTRRSSVEPALRTKIRQRNLLDERLLEHVKSKKLTELNRVHAAACLP